MAAQRDPYDATADAPGSVAQRLSDWAGSVLADIAIVATPPAREEPEGRWIGLYLMALAATAGTRGVKAPPLQFGVRCLVTASSADDLFELAFDAMDRPEFEVDFEPLTAEGWLAFGAPPRPAFALRVPMRKTRLRPVAPAVRAPLVIAPTPLVALLGAVVGPTEIGVAGAKVELAGLGLSTLTDHLGRFRFGGVPADRALRVRVLARGSTQVFEPGAAAALRGPLQLRMNFP
jgi:hypothetical protein